MRLSVSQLFTDYIYAQPLEAIGLALDDGCDTAEAVRGFAVLADEVFRAGGGILAPLTVFRGGDFLQPGQPCLKIQDDLVDSVTTITWEGPKIMEVTRLPLASTLTSFPSRVRALVLVNK